MTLIFDGKITISRQRLYHLLVAERRLEALEAGGVDNWDWYSNSLEDHYVEPLDTDINSEAIES